MTDRQRRRSSASRPRGDAMASCEPSRPAPTAARDDAGAPSTLLLRRRPAVGPAARARAAHRRRPERARPGHAHAGRGAVRRGPRRGVAAELTSAYSLAAFVVEGKLLLSADPGELQLGLLH